MYVLYTRYILLCALHVLDGHFNIIQTIRLISDVHLIRGTDTGFDRGNRGGLDGYVIDAVGFELLEGQE